MHALMDNPIEQLETRTGRKVPPPLKLTARKPMLWPTLAQSIPPTRTWLIDHWLSTGATLLAGAGGVGKSLLAQTIGTALALGRTFIDQIVAPHKVLMWACEDDHDELWRRQAAICSLFGISLADLEGKLVIEPRLGEDNSIFVPIYGNPTWTGLRDELESQIKDYGADVLIIDNVGQTFGCSENDRHCVTKFMNGCGALAKSVILLAHPAKAAGSEFSGSTAWENAARMRWYLGTTLPDQKPQDGEETEEPDQSVRYLAKRKANYTTRDYRKMTCHDGVISIEGQPMGPIAGPYMIAEARAAAERWIIQGIADLARIGMSGSMAPSSREFLPKKLAEMKLAGPHTVKELRDAMNRLLLAQRIKEAEVGKKVNRTPRFGLVVC